MWISYCNMIEINIPEQTKKQLEKLKDSLPSKGLVLVVGSSDQNWNMYILMEVLSFITENMNGASKDTVVDLGKDEDYYYCDWMRTVTPNDVGAAKLVYAASIRNEQKAKDVFAIAKNQIVLGLIHANDGKTGVITRLEEYGISKNDIENNLVVVIQQENNL